ncbi:hypothetical protein VP14_148 [Vibrio phage VPMCC14]|nr:hypothetical protein VP14_148 [Vibrio phage VPMCC14]
MKTFILFTTLLLSGLAHSATFTSKLTPDGQNIMIMTGRIDDGDDIKFKEFITTAPDNTSNVLFLNSRGGDLNAAIMIATILSTYDTTTVAFGSCASACAVIFSAGSKKYIPKSDLGFGEGNNRVGVHTPYVTLAGDKYEQKPESKPWWMIYGILLANGLTKQQALLFLGKMYSTPSEGMFYIDYKSAEQYGFIN